MVTPGWKFQNRFLAVCFLLWSSFYFYFPSFVYKYIENHLCKKKQDIFIRPNNSQHLQPLSLQYSPYCQKLVKTAAQFLYLKKMQYLYILLFLIISLCINIKLTYERPGHGCFCFVFFCFILCRSQTDPVCQVVSCQGFALRDDCR